ncbi:MAG: MBOAT family protein [Candidatus Omnitrophica bacterium]|nr:MBOAT family protein [Candidatus Omnitrophota bacterium]
MVFNSFEFVFFFVLVYALYRVLGRRLQNRMLLAASYVFYGAWDWRFLGLLWLTTAVDYACGILIERAENPSRRKLVLTLSLAANLCVLGFFKYFNFFTDNLLTLAEAAGFPLDAPTLQIILPVGISFYTFQSMSYTIDVYRRDIRAEKNLADFALFVAYFPQLVAGPIERASNLLPQIKQERRVSPRQIDEGAWLIYWGFFKKVFVADNLASIVNAVFAKTGVFPGAEALAGVYAFAFQIYGDFAGYSDIARGVSKLLGIELMVNFKYPYFVSAPGDFWRNWHISLSTWFRDYVYVPLGGSRGSRWLTARNVVATMLLAGLWHGAAWHFIVWGLYWAVLLFAYRMWPGRPDSRGGLLSVALMFHWTCLGWLIFRASDMAQAGEFLGNILFHFSWSSDASYYFAKTLFITAPLAGLMLAKKTKDDAWLVFRWPAAPRWALFLVLFYLIAMLGEFGGKEFIYFQF